jgi:hypothetical protein
MFQLLLVFLLFYFLYVFSKKETFYNLPCKCGCGCRRPGCSRCYNCPFCTSFTRSECPTRNMSYDLRGEAYFPERRNFPFDNSVIGPSNRRCYPKMNKYFD